jgi:hypothetical protein
MTGKRWALVMASSVGLVGLAAYLEPFQPAINDKNAARIQVGMTLADVEAILGGPARDVATGALEPENELLGTAEYWAAGVNIDLYRAETQCPDSPDARCIYAWTTNHVMVVVHLDRQGRVNDSYRIGVRRVHESLLDMLRRWLRL